MAAALWVLAACGGASGGGAGSGSGGGSGAGTGSGGGNGNGNGATELACNDWLAVEAAPSGAVNVRDAGAVGDGVADDTAAIQAALDALQPGQWLVFPPGEYRHSQVLVIGRRDVTLDGRGATLHASNPDEQAVLVQADGVRIVGFTMTATTDLRRLEPRHSRIAVWRDGAGLAPVSGVRILNNRIVESGNPGTPRANSASGAGIFVDNASDFVVAGNVIHRSLADGIQVVGGSRRGKVLYNTVRESGDDMIGVVSYLAEEPGEPAASMAADLARRRQDLLVRDVLIADNDLQGGYWGRGIAVVGGEDISILRNQVDAVSHAAGVYLGREQDYGSFGVRNVRVEDNVVTRVQTEPDAYTVLDPAERDLRTGHAALELVGHIYEDEAAIAALKDALQVVDIRIAGNRVRESAGGGLRSGYGWGVRDFDVVRDPQGQFQQRFMTGTSVSRIAIVDNRFESLDPGFEFVNAGDPALVLACSGNLRDGQPLSDPACRASPPSVSGAAQSCRAVPR